MNSDASGCYVTGCSHKTLAATALNQTNWLESDYNWGCIRCNEIAHQANGARWTHWGSHSPWTHRAGYKFQAPGPVFALADPTPLYVPGRYPRPGWRRDCFFFRPP